MPECHRPRCEFFLGLVFVTTRRAEHDPEISVDVPAFLLDDCIPDTGQRLEFYRRLA